MSDTTSLFFYQNNDIVVIAKFPDITDGTGVTTEFWYKDNKFTADTDPSSTMYVGDALTVGTDGIWFTQFHIPATHNALTGAFWWRVDAIDTQNHRRTAQCGTLLVEAVLWLKRRLRKSGLLKGLCITGLKVRAVLR
jgi:hypothetical protein